jgi:hypothetical protein
MHPRLKKIIFDKLYEDLKNVEIIPYKESIWFIDREKKYWYIEYRKNGTLWFRHDFFPRFFFLFSMERSEYELVIADWMKEVLNLNVDATITIKGTGFVRVGEVLNFKVDATGEAVSSRVDQVEEVLNFKVDTTLTSSDVRIFSAEEILNSTL